VRWITGAFSLLFLIAILSAASGALARSSEECLACHGDPAAHAKSVHKDLRCVDCHAGLKPDEVPHATRIAAVDCGACHGDVASTHRFHSTPAAPGAPPALIDRAACSSCHGTHDVASPRSGDSPLRGARMLETCGQCHGEVVARFKVSAHGRTLASGVAAAPGCLTCHQTPIARTQSPEDGAGLKLAQERLCLSCHVDNPEVRSRMTPATGFIAAYDGSVHGAALRRGEAKAAGCVDCHGSHEMEHGFEPGARVNRRRIPSTCGTCHAAIAAAYADSAHGRALDRGNHESPVCTDCHGEHDIGKAHDPRSPVAAGNVSARVCAPCHSSLRMERKYGLASDRFQTFSDSYHGLAIRGGDVEVANCASCHGAHDIRPSSDPRSAVNKANLAQTCGRCHPGANERFAIGLVHVATAEPEERVLRWIAVGYIGLIVVTVGGMLAHNAIDFVRRSRRRLQARSGLEERSHDPAGRGLYLRMTLGERWQHGTLLVSFIVLVVTGFMLHDPDAWWVAGLRRIHPRLFDLRSRLHRIAGVAMLLASLVHVAYVVVSARGRQLLRDLLPRRSDLSDALGVVRYNLGLAPSRPPFGRFSYVEKSEYWALVWGTLVMGLTGVILWFENTSIGFLTKLGWDVARTIHFYEAVLATLAILVWHLYFVVFNPDVYPMSTAWLTGYLSEEEMRDEHPLELEAIRRQRLEEALRKEPPPPAEPRDAPGEAPSRGAASGGRHDG
jgi:cytochrome b subunit of formate dehydrogenase